MTFRESLKHNRLSVISVLVALMALGYNSWRNEHSEANRTVRAAGFEIIRKLGELERIVFLLHYDHATQRTSPREGWVQVRVLHDLGQLMPAPVPDAAQNLSTAWQQNWDSLEASQDSAAAIEAAMQALREQALASIERLD